MSKRVLLILLPLAIAFSAIAGVYFSLKPKMQSWLLSQINRISSEKLPVQVEIQNVDWTLLFPEIQLQGIRISKKNFDLPPVEAERISASLDLLAMLGGRLAISSLLIEKPKAVIDLDEYLKSDDSKAEELPLKSFFELIKGVPLSRLGLRESEISLYSKKFKTKIYLGASDLLVIKGTDRLSLQFDFSDSVLEYDSSGQVPFRLQGEAALNPNTLDVYNLKLGVMNSLLTAKGSLVDLPKLMTDPKGTLEFEIFSELESVVQTSRNLFELPSILGKINSSGRMELKGGGKIDAGFKFSGQQLKVNQFDIGNLQFQGKMENDRLVIPSVELTNEAGLADIKDLEIDFSRSGPEKNITLKANLTSEQIDLHELLARLGIGDLPLEIFIGANFQCQGPVYPETQLGCVGKAKGEQLEVRTGEGVGNTIVQIDEFEADGDFSISNQEIKYKAALKVAEDRGASDGVINYKSGFKINYSSPLFHFKNIRRLAGLKIEGASEVLGSTQGDSHAATFTMKLKTQDLFFENFFLGAPSGNLSYQKGFLLFQNVEAHFPQTDYKLDLDIDLGKKRLQTAGQISKFEVNELMSILQRIFQFPFAVGGTGTATFKVEGPFELGKLSYDLNASIARGDVIGETFDKLEVDLHSDAGEMKIQKALIVKNKHEIKASGISHPNGDIDILVEGKGLPIEQSENISKLGTQISGILDVQTKLKGFILKPDIQIQGQLNQLVIEEQEFAESTFDLEFDRQSVLGKTNLFGGQLQGQFQFPLTENAPFQLSLIAKDWNYTTLFTLVGGGSLLSEYRASLTGNLKLASDRGGPWMASGTGKIDSLLLQRGSLSLRNPQPMEISMTNGIASLTNFKIQGDQTYFEVKGRRISHEELNLRIEGQAQLRLFQIFVPFLEELAGEATIAADVSGPLLKPEVLGNANVRNAFAKLKGFPHPFEKTQADVQFSQSKILINAFRGTLAGGTFDGDGSVIIAGPQNLPTSVKARLQNVNLNVPDRVRTTGDADLVFSGTWFPFKLSGTYYVRGGFVDKELADEVSGNNLKQSSYLPKMILRSAFEPVILDINIILEEPLQIKNSMVDGTVSGNVIVRGAPANPILGGQLVAGKSTKAIFRDKIFEVQSATVRFTSEDEINPEIYLTARSRITEYDINMVIQGRAKDPVVRLSSVPPLSDQDIISLIALGVTSQSLERQVQAGNEAKDKAVQAIAASAFTQIGLIKQIQKSTGVEIQVSSTYDDTRNVSVQRVTLSKKLSDKVRAAATQTSGSLSSQEYTLHYNFTESLSAVGRFEDRKYNTNNNSGGITTTNNEDQSILGIDLELKKEFK
ncbi:MAG: translocation/assembly module TamB domain-containing protein [Pseudobdellovibrionaceae bacterium]